MVEQFNIFVDKLESMIGSLRNVALQVDSATQEVAAGSQELSQATQEQASGIDKLNRAIGQIDTTTQQNASTVEELASTSDSLSMESRELAGHVERFKVSREAGRQTAPQKESRTMCTKQRPKPDGTPPKPGKQTRESQFDDFEEF
ncbi:MAG: methyl-accepting chemotaxis protein [Desulfomonilia bacterium]